MKYIYYMAFVSAVIVLGWILRPLEEHMSNGTCKRPVYGPKGVDAEKCARVYPEVYGPNGSGNRRANQQTTDNTGSNQTAAGIQNITKKEDGNGVTNPTSTTAMYEDSGEFRSDRATKNEDGNDVTNPTAMYEDNGEFRSDTATKNAAYMNVFTFKPYAKMDFPVSGPPAPYLSDFASFHR